MKKPLKISLIVIGVIIAIIVGLLVLIFSFEQIVYQVSTHRGRGLVNLKVNGSDGPEVSIVKGQAPILSWEIDKAIQQKNVCLILAKGYDLEGAVIGRNFKLQYYDKTELNTQNVLFREVFDKLVKGHYFLTCRPKVIGLIAALKSYGDLVKFRIVDE